MSDKKKYIGGGYQVTLTRDFTTDSNKLIKAGTTFSCTEQLYAELAEGGYLDPIKEIEQQTINEE